MACPICDKDSTERFRPFCSKRCADIDLGRWMLGSYAIPASEEDDPDEDDFVPGREDPTRH